MLTTLRLAIDEATYETLQDRARRQGKDPEICASNLVKDALRLLPATGRVVTISGAALETIEKILGGGSVLHAADLQQKVERLAGVSFLHCRLPFTPNQLEMLAEKAARNSLTVEQLVERTAPRIYEHFFNLVART